MIRDYAIGFGGGHNTSDRGDFLCRGGGAFGKGFTIQTIAAEVGINHTKVTVAKRKVVTTAD